MSLRPFPIVLVLGLALAAAPATAARRHSFGRPSPESCLRLLDAVTDVATPMKKTLAETAGWKSLVDRLAEGVGSHSKQPFVVRGDGASGFTPTAADLAKANVRVARIPDFPLPEGARLVRSPGFGFGYDLPKGFRRIGPLSYAVVDARGAILEIGAPSAAALNEFLRHVHGVELTPGELARVSKLNRRLLADLRKDPRAQAKLAEFAAKRGWPAGLAEEGGLAYFDDSFLNLGEWAKRNGFTTAELVDAGWYRVEFDRAGVPYFVSSSPDSIKIPYLGASGATDVPVWRSRNLAKDRPNLPKYIGWQIDRSVDRRFAPHEKLYNGWKLPSVKGKRIVVTEGEFKCLVAEKITGVPMFGIPGISEFDDDLAKAIVAAEPSEILVVLDRDPHAKALFRADEVTDSNRAAFTIAKQLESAGAKKVRVGILPEMADGEKLGIDDLVLKYGADPVKRMLDDATSADAYAAKIGLDREFQAVLHRRSKLQKAIEARKNHRRRLGLTGPDPVLAEAKAMLKKLERTYQSYLEHELNGARTMQTASGKANSVRPGLVPNPASKTVLFRENAFLEAETLEDDLLLLDYVPAGARAADCRPIGCGQTAFTRAELEAVYAGAEAPSANLESALAAAADLAAETGFAPKSFEEFATYALAGHLRNHFPFEEYRFDFGVRLDDAGRTAATLPLAIFKRKSGMAVAVANLHVPSANGYWERNEAAFAAFLDFIRGARR